MLLAHHHPAEYERCLRLGRRHVCRRCAVLYPAALVVMALSLLGLHWPSGLDAVLLWLLPVPAVAEFVGEHLGGVRHDPKRLVRLTLLASPALGRGFARYLENPGDRLWWNVVATYVLLGVVAVVAAQWRRHESRQDGPRYELLPPSPASVAASSTSPSESVEVSSSAGPM